MAEPTHGLGPSVTAGMRAPDARTPSRLSRLVPYLPYLLVAALLLPGLLQPGIFHPPLPKLNDATRVLLPWREFWREEILAGRLPLWNPYLYGGMPFLAEMQGAVFYPLNVLLLATQPMDLAFKLFLLLHLLIASYFLYRLARTFGASRSGATVGALAFALNGQFILFVFAGWINTLAVAAWAPAVLWALAEAQRGDWRRARRYVLLGAVFLTLQALGGHPEWMLYTILAAVGLAVGLAIECRGNGLAAALRRPAASLGIMLGLSALLAAPQLAPTVEAILQSSRGRDAFAGAATTLGAGYPVLFLPTVIVPKLFGPWDLHLSVDSWLHRALGLQVTIGDCLIYVGLIPLGLAAAGLRFRARVVSARFWAVMGLLALLLAANDVTRLASLLGAVLPVLRLFRNPARFVFLVCLPLCVLASFGATRLFDGEFRLGARVRRALYWLAGALGASGAALVAATPLGPRLASLVPSAHIQATLVARGLDLGSLGVVALRSTGVQLLVTAGLLLLAVWAVCAAGRPRGVLVVIAATAFDLALFAWPFVTSLESPAQIYAADLRRLANVPPGGRIHVADDRILQGGPNVLLVARRRSTGGYDTFWLRSYRQWLDAASQGDLEAYMATFGVRSWIAPGPALAAGRPPAWEISRRDRAVPLVYWTDRVIFAPDRGTGLAWLPRILDTRPPGVILIASEAPGDDPRPERSDDGPVEIAVDLPGRMTVRVDAPRAGWLVRDEMFYPGWRAEVDGARVEVRPVNAVFQGIPIAAGAHEVSFVFDPQSLQWGYAACAAGALLALGLLIWRPGAFRVRTALRGRAG